MRSEHDYYKLMYQIIATGFFVFSVIHYLLDDILGSAVIRCLEKDKSGILMEPNAVELICERF